MRDPIETLIAQAAESPPEEQEDWDLPPLRATLTPLSCP